MPRGVVGDFLIHVPEAGTVLLLCKGGSCHNIHQFIENDVSCEKSRFWNVVNLRYGNYRYGGVGSSIEVRAISCADPLPRKGFRTLHALVCLVMSTLTHGNDNRHAYWHQIIIATI